MSPDQRDSIRCVWCERRAILKLTGPPAEGEIRRGLSATRRQNTCASTAGMNATRAEKPF